MLQWFGYLTGNTQRKKQRKITCRTHFCTHVAHKAWKTAALAGVGVTGGTVAAVTHTGAICPVEPFGTLW